MSEKVPAKPVSNSLIQSQFNCDDPFNSVTWVKRNAVIVGSDGKEKFRQDDIEVPDWWNDTTVNVVAEKYFRVVNGTRENSAKQMFHRVAYWITHKGIEQGLLSGETGVDAKSGMTYFKGDALGFYNDLIYMFVNGMHAFNSPVWFNVGVQETPQCSACFIQSVDDTMESIVDLAKKEVMLFKGGSGTGSNLSNLRSSYEKLSGGGKASGPVSFMKFFDSGAGVTKSGGTTRRAAKMVVLNIDHPDILEQANGEEGFITCKAKSEQIAHDLYSTGKYTAEWNKPGNVYDLVGYQNANNSVRVTDDFMSAVVNDLPFQTKKVGDKSPVHDYKATELWEKISEAAWVCGDPGIQFDTTTNNWHTCPNSGRINASNPCSEYLFLDDTACNLSSLNLLRFVDGKNFKLGLFEHACQVATIAKEIIVGASSYPSAKITEMSHKYRTLGLGFTNLGALLTFWGVPYDSNEGRAIAGAITAVMTGAAYSVSADMARIKGPFPEYERNSGPMLGVIKKHWNAAKKIPSLVSKDWQAIVERAYDVWKEAYDKGKKWGYRNAQVTVIAPTGTISFLMGADTTGIEPMLGCVVYKKVVGEGLLVLPNGVVTPALKNLGYSEEAIAAILAHIRKIGTIHGAPGFSKKHAPIFAESLGDHALSPQAHIDMMIAVQPFISGGISKTVNMPKDATPKQIADIYMRAWKGGLKCVAVYRDGCKLSQPIATELTEAGKARKSLRWGERKKVAAERDAKNHKFDIAGYEGYMTVGIYDNGDPSEIFVRMAKQGSALSGILECWAIAISLGLQHGVPLETFVDKYQDMNFEPSGFTSNPDIRRAKSIPDYIFRYLDAKFGNKSKAPKEAKIESQPDNEPVSTSQNLDGPPCTKCGHFTKRAGSCYCCTQCGTTTGCS